MFTTKYPCMLLCFAFSFSRLYVDARTKTFSNPTWMTLNANDFFSHSIEHHFRIFRCAFHSVRKNLKYFKAITWKYVGESRWGMWVWQLISNVTNISPLIPRTGRPVDALKTATKINIPEKIPSRVVISVFIFMHACIRTMKIENGNYLRCRDGGPGRRVWISIHCFPPSNNTSDEFGGEKKYFKIICAIWFDDVSAGNHLMIIYCHCR